MIYLIMKNNDGSILCHDGEKGCEYINEYGEYEVWRDPDYEEYVKKYGRHFSPKLAEKASKTIRNVDGTSHYWTKEEVLNAIKSLNMSIPVWVEECDMHYMANYQYSEHFGEPMSIAKAESDIIKIALEEVWSPASYDGEVFLHYITDIMTNGEYIDFKEMM